MFYKLIKNIHTLIWIDNKPLRPRSNFISRSCVPSRHNGFNFTYLLASVSWLGNFPYQMDATRLLVACKESYNKKIIIKKKLFM